jgi:hypothetical protein
MGLDAIKPDVTKKRSQRLRVADGKPAAFIEWSGTLVKRNGRVPKPTHHLHFTSVIPGVSGDDPARTSDSPHLGHRLGLVRDEIDNKAGHRCIERAVRDGQRLCIAHLKSCALIREFVARELEKAVRRVDAGDATRRSRLKDNFAQGACAASNIKPFTLGRGAKPVYEFACYQPAPAADVRLICIATGPYILALSRHGIGPD